MERWDTEALANNADERRRVPRLLDYWKALGDPGSFPSLKDFNVEAIRDLAPHSFVLDLTGDPDDPVFRVVGTALTVNCGRHLAGKPLSATPRFSLLSRLTDHSRQVLESKAPAEFEAEYVNEKGVRTVYRAIMLPFGEDRQAIDYIVGAITWRTMLSETILAPLNKAKRLLRHVSAIGEVSLTDKAATAEFVIMLGRRTPDRAGTVQVLRVLDEKSSVVDAIVRRAAKSVAAGPATVFEPLNPDLKSTSFSLPPWPWLRRRSSEMRRSP